MYQRLELPPRPPITSSLYLPAVQHAGDVLRQASPWLLVAYEPGEYWVASRRTVLMRWVTWAVNLWRRPRRWWRGRLQLAYEARQRARKT